MSFVSLQRNTQRSIVRLFSFLFSSFRQRFQSGGAASHAHVRSFQKQGAGECEPGEPDSLDAIVHVARQFGDASLDGYNMPFWVVQESLCAHPPLPAFQAVRSRFMNRISTDASRLQDWKDLNEAANEAGATDVVSHFEKTTGHRLADLPERMIDLPVELADLKPVENSSVRQRNLDRRLPLDRRPERKVRTQVVQSRHRILAGTFALYLLFMASTSIGPQVDPLDIIQSTPEYSWVELGKTSRGGAHNPGAIASQHYYRALGRLRQARSSVWGFVPGVRKDLLHDGMIAMESAISFQSGHGMIHSEALLLLAHIYMDTGQEQKALALLEEAANGNTHRSLEARLLAVQIRQGNKSQARSR